MNTIIKSKKMNRLQELNDVLSYSESIVIYGAGRICYVLLDMLAELNSLKSVYCILVSDKKFNPDEIMGIPVCLVDDICDTWKGTVIIAAFEKSHDDIEKLLLQNGYTDVFAVSNSLYAELRATRPDFVIDLLNSVQWGRDDVKRSIDETRKARNLILKRLGRLEECLRKGVRFYEETLPESNYEEYLKEWYERQTGKMLDLSDPHTYNEKIQWIKLHGISDEMRMLSDKYAVRQWVERKIGEEYLIPVYGVFEDFSEIPFSDLPDQFVIKCSHGSGMNAIVRDKSNLSITRLKKKFSNWMDIDFSFQFGLEMQYFNIPPRIILEEYLENDSVGGLFDYKFWCFNGHVEFIMFLSERSSVLKMNNYDKDWNLLPFTYNYDNNPNPISKPDNLDEMIEIAEKLAEGFPHVRVDLYRLNDGRIKFGEMTFTSDSGVCRWSDDTIDRKLGDMIDLNMFLK